MTEYPGFLPWHIAGDPWFTHHELLAIGEDLERRIDERKKQAKEAAAAKTRRGRRGRRGRRR